MIRAVLVALAASSGLSGAAARDRTWTILPESAASEARHLCSREGPPTFEGTWALTARDVRESEQRLGMVSLLNGDGALDGIKAPRRYSRQYIGLVIGGRKWKYVDAFMADGSASGWRTKLSDTCAGGTAAWGVLYDPATRCFSQLRANGI